MNALELENQSETLVNTDVLLREYKSAYNEAAQDMEDCDSKIEEQNVNKGEAAIRKGKALYNIKLHMTDEEWKDWIESDECKDSRTVTYNLISIYENFSSSPAGGIGYTKMAELLPLKDNLKDFLSQYDVEHMSREQIRRAKKEYKGEMSPKEDSGKDAIPAERRDVASALTSRVSELELECSKLNDKVKGLIIIRDRKNKKIEQLQTENQKLRDENRVLNERDSLDDADKLYEASSFYRNYADNHSGDICGDFDDYVEKRLEEARQEAINQYKESEAYKAY